MSLTVDQHLSSVLSVSIPYTHSIHTVSPVFQDEKESSKKEEKPKEEKKEGEGEGEKKEDDKKDDASTKNRPYPEVL